MSDLNSHYVPVSQIAKNLSLAVKLLGVTVPSRRTWFRITRDKTNFDHFKTNFNYKVIFY